MLAKATMSPINQKHFQESFEDKHERRLEYHEALRSRHNATSCRQNSPDWGRDQEKLQTSPRQQELFRRRQLYAENTGDKCIKSPPKYHKYSKCSPVRLSVENQIKKEEEVSPNNKISWHHNHSSSSPRNPAGFRPDMMNYSFQWEPSSRGINTQNVSTRERGVQTVQDPPTLCIKRESSQQTDSSVTVLNGELLELSEYLEEALQRERKLKKKLCILQELLSVLVQASDKSWKVQVNEDRLKCKVLNLENQLFLYSQNIPKTSVKKILLEMEEQKYRYEEKANESLQKLTEDKLTTERQLHKTQMSLAVSGDECELWKEEYEKLKKDWSDIISENSELRNELNVVQSKLQWVETQDTHLQQLHDHLQSLERERIELKSQNEILHEDNDLQKQQLNSMEVRLRNAEEEKLETQLKIHNLQNQMLSMNERNTHSPIQDIKNVHRSHTSNEQPPSEQLLLVTEKLTAKENELAKLKIEMESLALEYKSCKDTLQLCRENLKGIPKQKPKSGTSCWASVLVLFVAVLTMIIISANMEYLID
ncbi:TRAF3-interacting JNK-activating modulator [Pelobates fuscus]|uniref:TRAF3-interacting JNK-activating modulator n=1 Tax=Pelobates fuscus TaxID=191477 RepID=UPI002FE43C3F